MKRTNIVLDETLVEEGLRVTGLPSRRALVDYALKDLIRRKRQKAILTRRGKIRWEGNLDDMRETR